MEKIAASVLLKVFMNGIEKYHTIDAPTLAQKQNSIL